MTTQSCVCVPNVPAVNIYSLANDKQGYDRVVIFYKFFAYKALKYFFFYIVLRLIGFFYFSIYLNKDEFNYT